MSDYANRLAAVAEGEWKSFGGVPETDPRLRTRIYKTYLADLAKADPQDPQGWNMGSDISAWAWSATFVSWCVLAAGATVSEFDFSIRHSVFVNKAIGNATTGKGVFRARRLTDYAPKIGDIIAWNRGGTKFSYDYAAQNNNFQSHSTIVIDIIVKAGIRYAVTIGGNEGQTVGRTEVQLTASGHVKPRTVNPYICVIENLKADAAVAIKAQPAAVGSLSPALKGHGAFIYDVPATIADYGSLPNLTAALKRAGMQHVWVRIHGRTPYTAAAKAQNQALIDACKAAGVAVAGWGWCQGEAPEAEAKAALKELKAYGLTDYVADIEPKHNNSEWTISEIQTFCSTVRKGLSGSFGFSTFGFIDWHEPDLLMAAAPYVDAFAPQIYWFNFPNQKMVQQFKRPGGGLYQAQTPGEYVDLCLDRWTKWMGSNPKPLIVTGQAYWGEGGFTEAQADQKLQAFVSNWKGYDRIAGLNWWHFGGSGGMSHLMFEAIAGANLGGKPFSNRG